MRRVLMLVLIAAVMLPYTVASSQSDGETVWYEDTLTLPARQKTPASSIWNDLPDQQVTLRVTGPESITPGEVTVLTIDFIAPDHDGAIDPDASWEITQAEIALILPDDTVELMDIATQRILLNDGGNTTWLFAQPPTDAEAIWVPLAMHGLVTLMSMAVGGLGEGFELVQFLWEAGQLTADYEDVLDAIQAGRPLTDMELRAVYEFENAYDIFEIPDYDGKGGAPGDRVIKRYQIPLRFAEATPITLLVKAVQMSNSYPITGTTMNQSAVLPHPAMIALTPGDQADTAALGDITPVSSNDEWTPVVQEFDGVEMVLVPPGCFTMGSTDAQVDYALELCASGRDDCQRSWFEHEQPAHEQCFDAPFWIDRYEVTNGQFERLGGTAAEQSHWTEEDRPRQRITWFEARDFCERRGARLPTEAEWEYAARGPDSLVYPWGNEFEANHVVYAGNSDETAPVGSRTGGVSWVGAYNMSGNVWEWVSSGYADYPYDANDERESDVGVDYRVLRGGSFGAMVMNLRASDRHGTGPQFVNINVGARCVRPYQ